MGGIERGKLSKVNNGGRERERERERGEKQANQPKEEEGGLL
jgi:hypothetical protein